MPVIFIPDKLVFLIHSDLIRRYGGLEGIRDFNLLESALAQPKMTAGGKSIHKTIFQKAAAYGYHICLNHPFIDGNKRIAFVLMDIFLQKNGGEITATEQQAYLMMIQLASGKLNKSQLSLWLRKCSSRITK